MDGRNQRDLDLALRLASAADAISVARFGETLRVDQKQDGSLVSAADLEVEAELLAILRHERRDDAVLSEEAGEAAGGSGRQWILDPIDGTEPFLSGARCWGTHIALSVAGRLELAVITRPTEARSWWAIRGQGAWTAAGGTDDGPTSLAVSRTDRLNRARIAGFTPSDSALATTLARYGTWVEDPLGPAIALIEARVDVVVCPAGAPWDHAPAVLLTTEANGDYLDRDGGRSHAAGGGVYTNGRLMGQVLAVPHFRRLNGWSPAG